MAMLTPTLVPLSVIADWNHSISQILSIMYIPVNRNAARILERHPVLSFRSRSNMYALWLLVLSLQETTFETQLASETQRTITDNRYVSHII